MKLIKKLGTRLSKKGHLQSWAIFWCDFCKSEVEKELGQGVRDKSCGCKKIKFNNQNGKNNSNYTHGGSKTKLYAIWHGMKQRCYDFNNISYKNYGGRGITVCNEWLEFIPFRDWALNNGYKESLVIDRINNNGNYEPNNCQWITILESNRNKRNIKLSLYKAEEIKNKFKTGNYSKRSLAKEYDTSERNIKFVTDNISWKNE